MKTSFISLVFLFVSYFTFAQFGNDCGVPVWDATRNYSIGYHVYHTNNVYRNAGYVNANTAAPDVNPNWTLLGACTSSIVPIASDADCASATDWVSQSGTTGHYDVADFVSYKNGLYKPKYYILANVRPDSHDAYTFEGVCVRPPAVTSNIATSQNYTMDPLQNILATAIVQDFGVDITEVLITIQKDGANVLSQVLSESTVTAGNYDYNWLPTAYGAYTLVFKATNQSNKEGLYNASIIINRQVPPSISLVSPADGSLSYYTASQPISLVFNAQVNGNLPPKKVYYKTTANSQAVYASYANSNYRTSWTPAQDGITTITAFVEDEKGNIASIVFSLEAYNSNCAAPNWYSTRNYPFTSGTPSTVYYKGLLYENTAYVTSGGNPPNTNTSWTNTGTCTPANLTIQTNCDDFINWVSKPDNYVGNVNVVYNEGLYRTSYPIIGTVTPDQSDAYVFLGICVKPPVLTSSFEGAKTFIQPTLQTINILTTIVDVDFPISTAKVFIKKFSQSTFQSFDMTLGANNQYSYGFIPDAYTDYNIRIEAKNSINLSSELIGTIKVAKNQPPNIALTSPKSDSRFFQLNFTPIVIHFTTSQTDRPIQSISLYDEFTTTTSSASATATSISWTPSQYGITNLRLGITDDMGTSNYVYLKYEIIDPSKESILFANLPYQLKSLEGVTKVFTFDKTITSVKSRDLSLTQFSFVNSKLTVNSNNPGRTGLEIITSDGDKYYIGLRIDNSDGTVPRYPTHISIGSVSEDIPDDVNFFNNGINNTNLMLNNRMDVRYTYINGGPLIGWNTWQPDRVMKFARNSLKMGLMPVFIFYNIPDGGESYTTNLEHIQSPTYMTAYFENLELFLNQVRDIVGDEFFGVIFEPDFLGYMQQNSEPETLATAVGATTIGTNAGTLKSLVERINFEINKKRIDDNLNLEFGWQLNLWAKPNVAGVRGIIRETDNVSGVGGGDFPTQLQKIKQTAIDIYKYGETMGIMSHNADFISIDKYGLDALGYSNASDLADPSSWTWFFNNDHWLNYFAFVRALFEEAGVHVILWQITVGHINGSTTINEYTGTNFATFPNTSKYYEDSASPFFFGDEIDFSNDQARFDYFSQNKHNDPKLISNPTSKHVTFGNHFEELNDIGVKLVLMGAGVGDSTDGIGDPVAPGATLTDGHFWIQKVQDYYINHLITSTLGIDSSEISDLTPDFTVLIDNQQLIIKNISKTPKNTHVYLFDFTGKRLIDKPNQQIGTSETIRLSHTIPSNTFYICILKTEGSVGAFKIISK